MAVRQHPAMAATVLSLLLVVVLFGTLVVDPRVADRLTREDDLVEWLQTALFVLAAIFALRSAWQTWRYGASPVFEVLLAAALVALIVGEIDLDRIIVGRKIVATRFLVDARVWIGWRVLAALVQVVPPAALMVYAVRRRAELVAGLRRGLARSEGRVFLAGVMIFGLTEIFERQLGHVPGVPTYFLEETLELVAAICFGVALYAHAPAAERGRVPHAETASVRAQRPLDSGAGVTPRARRYRAGCSDSDSA
jgi:hypothetical protein